VAEFIGMPRIAWFEGELERKRFRCADFELEVPGVEPGAGATVLGIRPHDLQLVPPERATLQAAVDLTEPLGATLLVHARSEHGVRFRVLVAADTDVQRGHTIGVEIAPDRVHLFRSETGERLASLH
jgi:ABC-type sugar transport system ATPase subunit